VTVRLDGLEISLCVEGLGSLLEELRLREAAEQRGQREAAEQQAA
jgi:hypothetical protein